MSEEPNSAKELAAILVPIVFSIIFIVGVIGNTLVIAVLARVFKRETQGLNTTNRFIFNLAISDMLFLFFCVPFQAPIYSMDSWPFGPFMCVFCEVCQMISMLASIYTMVALSLDRYFAVVHATSSRQFRTRNNANICILAVWGLSVGLGTAAMLTRRLYTMEEVWILLNRGNELASTNSSTTEAEIRLNHTPSSTPETTMNLNTLSSTAEAEIRLNHTPNSTPETTMNVNVVSDVTTTQPKLYSGDEAVCMQNYERRAFDSVYRIVIALLGYLVPVLVNFICYMGVLRTMSTNAKNAAVSTNRRSQDAKKRVTKIVMLVVLCFAIDWFPYHFCNLLFRFTDVALTEAVFALPIIAHCLSYSNSCVNPIIYAFMSKQFRYDLKMVFKRYKLSRFKTNKFCSRCFPNKATEGSDDSTKDGSIVNRSWKGNSKKIISPPANASHKNTEIKMEINCREESNSTCMLTLTPAICHPTRCFNYEQSPLLKTTNFTFQKQLEMTVDSEKENQEYPIHNTNNHDEIGGKFFANSNNNLSADSQVLTNSNKEKSKLNDDPEIPDESRTKYSSKSKKYETNVNYFDRIVLHDKDETYCGDEISEMF